MKKNLRLITLVVHFKIQSQDNLENMTFHDFRTVYALICQTILLQKASNLNETQLDRTQR